MKVRDLMTRNIVSVSSDENIGKALVKMKKYGFHQMPVIDDKKLSGMLVLKNIISRDTGIVMAKVGKMVVHTPELKQDDDLKKAVELLLRSGVRALPVTDGKNIIGIISETDVMRIVAESKMNYKAEDIATECEYLTKNDNVGKVRKLMAYKNISRFPVIDGNKIVGIIGTLDLIDIFLKGKQDFGGRADTKDRGYKEPLTLDKISVEILMRMPAFIDKNTNIVNVSKLLLKNEEALIQHDEKLYIVTAKDVLELLVKITKEGVYVQITGLKDEDEFVTAKIDAAVTTFVQKIGKMMKNLQSLTIYIERHSPGGRIKYSVRARLLTPLGLFVSRAWGWELVTVMQKAVKKLEKEILKKYERIKTHDAEKKSKILRRKL